MTDSKALIERLRADWPEILVEKHWMMDSDAIEEQRQEAADHIEKLEAELDRCRKSNVVMDNTVRELEADNPRLREAMKGPLAWLERWAVHVGNCKGGSACTCGLTFVQHELRAALQETSHDQ